ncbi:hypothetical protein H6F87_27235 [Cyanobacteria bacterium FACHB-502]|uniref:hypothetical protein n=1 Tax=Leptolyngbya sp. GB1-A1 TaxID=2933908 RepID=UPI0019BC6B35|nr:hypothetical protein [Cyanobacteria bacterium FACHB-502]
MRNLRDREVYDNELRRQAQIDRENSSAASGVALGIAIAGLVGAGIAAYAFFNRPSESQAPRQNTVIERTREIVPAQPQAPDVKAPDINITVPNPAPTQESELTQPESNAQRSSDSDSSTSSPNPAPPSENP